MGSEDQRRLRFEALFEENSRPLLAYALRRVERPEDAADALSEIMLVAWRRLDAVPAGAEARLWLFGVARGVLSNQRRASRRRTRLGERLRDEIGEAWAYDHADGWDEQHAVRAAVRRLEENDREVILLTAWEGLGPSEIAKVLSIPPATVRSRLHRALARLRRELEAAGWSDERSDRPGHVGDGGRLLARYAEEEL